MTFPIDGENVDYLYVKCPRCGIWVQKDTYESKHEGSPDCDNWTRTRETRERATKRALGDLNKISRRLLK